ncbi:unnamed protein product [Trifolium pratense]|uniref:Uncharacterized protein n=1 Tax=Trifolium pratense TaxID=57577 RepID=A0ACB0LPC4_TRIPR|nr:unnamed protein product [Trifolium pratense]
MLPFVKHVLFGTPYQQYGQIEDPQTFANDPLAWSRPLVRYYSGEFSMAAVQANRDMEDKCQVEVGIDALFVGIYDGQKGVTVSIFLRDQMFNQIIVDFGKGYQIRMLLKLLTPVHEMESQKDLPHLLYRMGLKEGAEHIVNL